MIDVRLKQCEIKLLSIKIFVWLACYVTSKMIEILDNVVLSIDGIDLDYINFDIAKFFSDDMEINNYSHDDNLETMIHVRLVAWYYQNILVWGYKDIFYTKIDKIYLL